MNDILKDIISKKNISVHQKKILTPVSELKEKAIAVKHRDFKEALRNKNTVNIIAEIKQASPSAGIIRPHFDPAVIAAEYTKAGAAAISVLTEEEYFKGKAEYLSLVRDHSTLPILCKDFITDDYQLYEAAANGADAALLIVAILSDVQLGRLMDTAFKIGLCPLVEIHNEAELERAVAANAEVIGINNRDLKTLYVNMDTAFELIPKVPEKKILVVESGIKKFDDIERYLKIGARSFLIGEALMKQENITEALKGLKNG